MKPDYEHEISKPKNGLSVSIEFFGPNENFFKTVGAIVNEQVAAIILEKVKHELPTLLGPENFLGEAENYMAKNGVPFSPKTRLVYAKDFYNELIASLDKTVQYNKEENAIFISPYIFTLEYGDFYRPALNFITTCINKWLIDIEIKKREAMLEQLQDS